MEAIGARETKNAQADGASPGTADGLRDWALARRDALRADEGLLRELGLKLDGGNILEFGPLALSRVVAERERELGERRRLEAVAQANFAAQAQTHAAVVDLMESRNLADLARRIDDLARLRFGLAAGVVALEGPGPAPPGWRPLMQGQLELLLGARRLTLMGHAPTALGLFAEPVSPIASVALVRLAIWEPARAGLLAFGAPDPAAFAADMGVELVSFLARVTERTAERWQSPSLER